MNTPAPTPSPTPPAAPLVVWWVLWFAMTNGLILQRLFLGGNPASDQVTLGYIALGPLVVSAIIRFVVLPRMKTKQKAFPLFVAGLATAEACGLMGLFLGGGNRDTFVIAGVGMLLAYAPLFARKYDCDGGPLRQT